MGYYIEQVGIARIRLDASRQDQAMRNLQALQRHDNTCGCFMDYDGLWAAPNLRGALECCRYNADVGGADILMQFTGEKRGCRDRDILLALAKAGAEGEVTFLGETCGYEPRELRPKWTFKLADGDVTEEWNEEVVE